MNANLKFFILFTFLINGLYGFGQPPVFFKNLSIDEAQKLAGSTKQLIFIQLETDCNECNRVAYNGLSGNGVSDIYEKFICINVDSKSEGFKNISKKYRISPILPTSVFLDHEGNFITMMYDKSTSNSAEYIQLAAMAMANQKNPPLQSFEKKYASGNYTNDFLKSYLIELQKFNFDNEDVLEEYIGKLSIDSLLSKNNLVFIMNCAPVISSKSDRLMHFDDKFFKEVFMSLPLNERIKINSQIIAKSRKKAVFEKDPDYMYKVASFIQGTYDDWEKGRNAYFYNFARFYKDVNDTIEYMRTAHNYYTTCFEKANIDSIAKIEMEKTVEIAPGRFIKGGNLLETGTRINEMAWTIYEFTDDLELLAKALKWSERTLVYENPAFHDTYAHILYKMGITEKAIEFQRKAIDLAKEKHYPEQPLLEELNKMIEGTF